MLLKQSIEYNVLDQEVIITEDASVHRFKLVLKEEARGAIIDLNQLNHLLGETALPQPIRITNSNALQYELTGYRYDTPQGTLRISGDVTLESQIEADSLKKYIAENNLKKSADILRAFPALATVEVRFYPFWWQSLSRIDIKFPMR